MQMKWPLGLGVALHGLALISAIATLVNAGQGNEDLLLFTGVFFALGEIAFVDGLGQYAQWKGYHFGWGVMGLLSLAGLAVLWRLPYRESDYPRHRPPGFDVILLGMDD